MRSSKTPIRTVACVVGLGLMFVQAALAAEKQPIRFNASDQAAAKAATLKRSDLGSGWNGGVQRPDLNPTDPCPMKRTDLVLTGAAKTEFKTAGASISSESNVLQSAALVTAEWQRSTGSTAYMSCIRRTYMAANGSEMKMVSFTKLTFPKLTRYGARYRVVMDIAATDADPSARVLVDVILLAHGRTEISLLVSTLYSDRASADVVERRLAQVLVNRFAA